MRRPEPLLNFLKVRSVYNLCPGGHALRKDSSIFSLVIRKNNDCGKVKLGFI